MKGMSIGRKLCEKESQSFSHCGFFDHPNLQSLNDYIFFIFILRLQFKKFKAWNTPLESYFQDLSNGILQAPTFLKY
jgi:hypothetical protein